MTRDAVWVVDGPTGVLGFAHLSILDADRAELCALYLLPELLGQGFGRALLELAFQHARERGCTRVVLSATKTAMPFYLSQGFQRVPGCASRDINGVNVDCLPMERPLW